MTAKTEPGPEAPATASQAAADICGIDDAAVSVTAAASRQGPHSRVGTGVRTPW